MYVVVYQKLPVQLCSCKEEYDNKESFLQRKSHQIKGMGMIPVKNTKKDPLTWKIVDPALPTSGSEPNGLQSNNSTNSNECIETKVTIPNIGASGLGCSIVKGPPEFPGIYIQSVKKGSLAEQAGLQVGDRIIKMNGHNFSSLDFSDAVSVLKSSKQMQLVLHKGGGLDLFLDGNLKKEMETHTFPANEDGKRFSTVQDDGSNEERETKQMNGQIPRASNGSVHYSFNSSTKQEIIVNGHSTSSETSSLQTDANEDDDSLTNCNHNIKVHATVHTTESKEEINSNVNTSTRESGDGMEYDSKDHHMQSACYPWTGSYDEKECKSDQISEDNCSDSTGSPSLDIKNFHHKSSNSEKQGVMDLLHGHKYAFLSEIHRNGDKSSVTSEEKSEMSSLSSDDYLGIPKVSTKPDQMKPQNEFLKRKQHELLMEEFREAHKKMFGQVLQRAPKPPKLRSKETEENTNPYQRRQQVRNERVTPPPPPPPSDFMSSGVLQMANESNKTFTQDIEQVTYKRRQREPPITDSRGPEPKPPPTYFDKPDGGPKPLVTIGTYPNNLKQNRFLCANSVNTKSQEHHAKKSATSCQQQFSTFGDFKNSNQSSSLSSTVPSSSSSEPRSPTSESVTSSDSIFNASVPSETNSKAMAVTNETLLSVSNNFQNSLNQFSKNIKDGKKQAPLPKSCKDKPAHSTNSGDPYSEFPDYETEGRELQTVTLVKNGPLNFRIEGGINSDLAGKIIVSEVWDRSCTLQGGKIQLGDQILKVDNTKLTGLSLTAANVALRNANSNSKREMVLIIAKAKKT